ncbi:MAG: glycoside hydrolase family 57 protein [Candidatus Omnitrophota bacterium]
MLYLAFIYHMHQPYYKDLLTGMSLFPWVRLHGIKDYLDMVEILRKFPAVHQTFNLVPSLLEQLEDYTAGTVKDRFVELTLKPAIELTADDQKFLLERFFSIFPDYCIAVSPRYYELYLKNKSKAPFSTQDYLDLQVWFNLAWFDPSFKQSMPVLRDLVRKARFFSEEDKRLCLDAQIEVLNRVIPAYKEFMGRGQVEVILSPFYHPILPLLYNSNIGKEANLRAILPKTVFNYPQDAKSQVDSAVSFYKERFGALPQGMWPSEESVCEHILPILIDSGIKWIVTDEAILFKSLRKNKRDTRLIYKPHLLKRKDGQISIIFRDRNLSDLIGFEYHRYPKAEDAVNDFMKHLENIDKAFKGKDPFVAVALDGENAWEYYRNDGHDFLELLYARLSESKFLKCVTVNEYLNERPAKDNIKHLAAGSWINGDFSKWIGSPYKNLAWEYLIKARREFESVSADFKDYELARKQMAILEGSDWFWWYGDDPGYFDELFRMHLSNFYSIIGKDVPGYLSKPLEP